MVVGLLARARAVEARARLWVGGWGRGGGALVNYWLLYFHLALFKLIKIMEILVANHMSTYWCYQVTNVQSVTMYTTVTHVHKCHPFLQVSACPQVSPLFTSVAQIQPQCSNAVRQFLGNCFHSKSWQVLGDTTGDKSNISKYVLQTIIWRFKSYLIHLSSCYSKHSPILTIKFILNAFKNSFPFFLLDWVYARLIHMSILRDRYTDLHLSKHLYV